MKWRWEETRKGIGWCGYFYGGGYVFKIRSNMEFLVSANVSFICCFYALRLCIYTH
jgi:hypothetical protein